MKKMIIMVLAALMLTLSANTAFAAHWATEYLNKYEELGIIDSWKYTADKSIQRAEAMRILYERVDPEEGNVSVPDFVDIDDHPQKKVFRALAELGWLKGYLIEGKYFVNPDEYVTRSQMTAFVIRATGKDTSKPSSKPFPDVSKEHWAAAEINKAKKLGIIEGYPDGEFSPDRLVTQAEFVKIVEESRSMLSQDLDDDLDTPDIDVSYEGNGEIDVKIDNIPSDEDIEAVICLDGDDEKRTRREDNTIHVSKNGTYRVYVQFEDEDGNAVSERSRTVKVSVSDLDDEDHDNDNVNDYTPGEGASSTPGEDNHTAGGNVTPPPASTVDDYTPGEGATSTPGEDNKPAGGSVEQPPAPADSNVDPPPIR